MLDELSLLVRVVVLEAAHVETVTRRPPFGSKANNRSRLLVSASLDGKARLALAPLRKVDWSPGGPRPRDACRLSVVFRRHPGPPLSLRPCDQDAGRRPALEDLFQHGVTPRELFARDDRTEGLGQMVAPPSVRRG